jgi:hypothetical protein
MWARLLASSLGAGFDCHQSGDVLVTETEMASEGRDARESCGREPVRDCVLGDLEEGRNLGLIGQSSRGGRISSRRSRSRSSSIRSCDRADSSPC